MEERIKWCERLPFSHQAQLKQPWGGAVAPDGSVYVADYQNVRVRKIATDGVITTVAGIGVVGYSGDGGPGGLFKKWPKKSKPKKALRWL